MKIRDRGYVIFYFMLKILKIKINLSFELLNF